MNFSYHLRLLLFVATALSLFACAPQRKALDSTIADGSTPEAPADFDAEFTLKTIAEGGKLAYMGVGGEIEGVVNPDLVVRPGEIVRIVLVNGDGMPHDLFLPDRDVKSDYVSKIGDETEFVFEVGDLEAGAYAYYCTVPGHRQAGQEGKLIVVEPVE